MVPLFKAVKRAHHWYYAFKHAVFFKEFEIFTNNPVREHHPFIFAKELDSTSVTLYQYMTRGTIMDSVTIDWYWFNEKTPKR